MPSISRRRSGQAHMSMWRGLVGGDLWGTLIPQAPEQCVPEHELEGVMLRLVVKSTEGTVPTWSIERLHSAKKEETKHIHIAQCRAETSAELMGVKVRSAKVPGHPTG